MARYTKHDPIKVALADYVFDAVLFGIHTRPQLGQELAPQFEPLEDVIMETARISDLELDIRTIGKGGKLRSFAVKLSEDRM